MDSEDRMSFSQYLNRLNSRRRVLTPLSTGARPTPNIMDTRTYVEDYCHLRIHICACGKMWNGTQLCGRNHSSEGHETVESLYYHAGYICENVHETERCAEPVYFTDDQGNRRPFDDIRAHSIIEETLTKTFKVAYTKCGCEETISTKKWSLHSTHPQWSRVRYFPQIPETRSSYSAFIEHSLRASHRRREEIVGNHSRDSDSGNSLRDLSAHDATVRSFDRPPLPAVDHTPVATEPSHRSGSLSSTTIYKLTRVCQSCANSRKFPLRFLTTSSKPTKAEVEAQFVAIGCDNRLAWDNILPPELVGVFAGPETVRAVFREANVQAQQGCSKMAGIDGVIDDGMPPSDRLGMRSFNSVDYPLDPNRSIFR